MHLQIPDKNVNVFILIYFTDAQYGHKIKISRIEDTLKTKEPCGY